MKRLSDEYIIAERIYCDVELAAFFAAQTHEEQEYRREKVIGKRKEFAERWENENPDS